MRACLRLLLKTGVPLRATAVGCLATSRKIVVLRLDQDIAARQIQIINRDLPIIKLELMESLGENPHPKHIWRSTSKVVKLMDYLTQGVIFLLSQDVSYLMQN